MELFDINNIHSILAYEFGDLFYPKRRNLIDGALRYEGNLKNVSPSSLKPLIERFKELGYDVEVFGTEPGVTLQFKVRSQKSGVSIQEKEESLKETDKNTWAFTEIDTERVQLSPPKERYGLHFLLFGLTLYSTLCAGAYLYYGDIYKSLFDPLKGLSFAIPLLLILLAHEMGHYFLSRSHDINATLPFFIPFPNIIGTLGAIIKMKSPVPDRDALIDVGMAGPLAGVIVAIPVTFIGLMLSKVKIQTLPELTGGIMLGESLLFKILSWLIYGRLPQNAQLSIHPMAFAGWVGFLVTFMNLFPVSQLDGGHISYALFGHWHKLIGKIICIVFALLGIIYWPWFIWLGFVLFIGIGHPPPLNNNKPISRRKKILGIICMGIFILTFIPRPFYGPDMPVDLFSLFRALMGKGF